MSATLEVLNEKLQQIRKMIAESDSRSHDYDVLLKQEREIQEQLKHIRKLLTEGYNNLIKG